LITLNVVFIESLRTYQNCPAERRREDVMAVTEWASIPREAREPDGRETAQTATVDSKANRLRALLRERML
jgi:hypothetical protein